MSSPRSPAFEAPAMPKTVFGFGSSAPRYCNKPTVTPPSAKLASSRSGRSPSPTMGSTPSRASPPRRLSSSPRRSLSPNQSQYESVHSPAPSAHLRSNAYSPSQSLVESLSRPLPSSRPAFGSTGPRLAPTTPSPVKPRLPYSRGTVVGSLRASPQQQQYLRSSHAQSHSHTHSLNGSPRTVHSEEGEAYGHSHHTEERGGAYDNMNNYENTNTEKHNNNSKKSIYEDELPTEKLSLPEPSAQPAVDVATTAVVDTQPAVTAVATSSVPSSEPAQTTSEEPVARSIVVYSNEDQEVQEVRELDLSSAHMALRQHIADFELGVTLEEDLAEAVLSSLFRERRPFCAEEICECRAYKTDYKPSHKEEGDETSERSAFLAQLSVAGERAASAVVVFDSRKPVIAVTQLRFDEEANNEAH